MGTSRIYNFELLEEAVKKSFSFADVCRVLNKSPRGGTFELIRNRIREYDIDTSHFQKGGFKKGNISSKKRKKEDVLVSGHLYRLNHCLLKRCLIESGREYKCEVCGISEWNDKEITLDIDHINGDWSDCRLDNLRFICPNCHRQTDTFGSRNLKKEKIVKQLKEKKKRKSKLDLIDIEILKIEIWNIPCSILCKKYNISDRGLSKICRKLNIKCPERGYWTKLKHGKIAEMD